MSTGFVYNTPRRTCRGSILLFAVLMLAAVAAEARGSTHLVKALENWDATAAKLKPGDEIVLMPGKHRPFTLSGVAGSQQQPIVIRGLTPDTPSVIAAERFGIELHRCQHVVIKDLSITGATIYGIAIDNEPRGEDTDPFEANITIHNVRIERTGPEGQRDAISLKGVSQVRAKSTEIRGWAGAAVSMVACTQITLDDVRARAMDDHSQLFGVTMRSGCKQIMITRCQFEQTATAGIFIGGTSKLQDFLPPIPELVSPGTINEVTGLVIDRCLFNHCSRPFDFAHAADWSIRQNTIVRPVDLILGLRVEQQSDKFDRGGRGMFAMNIITWEPGELTRLSFVEESINLRHFQLARNLLWSPETPEAREQLGNLPQAKTAAAQLTDLDPQLDEDFRPTMGKARQFGWKGGTGTASAHER